MSVRKLGSQWYADITWNGKRYRKRSADNTKQGARELELLISRTLSRDGNLDALDPVRQEALRAPLFADYAKSWMTSYVLANNKPSEQASKETMLRRHLLPFFGQQRLDEIRPVHVSTFVVARQGQGVKNKTINNELAVLRKLLRSAEDDEILERAPRVKALKTTSPDPKFLTLAEVRQVLDIADEPWRTMILIATFAGLRFGELVALQWDAVHLDGSFPHLRVHRTLVDGIEGTPKNHRHRTVPLPELVAQVLRGRTRQGPWLFTRYGGPITHKMADNALKAICKRLDREKFGWHTLRHTYATWLVQQAASLHHVGMLLGHSSEKVTRVYIHLRPEYLQSTVAKLDTELEALGQPAGKEASQDAFGHQKTAR